MGGVADAVGGWVGDVTGKTQREEKKQAQSTQAQNKENSQKAFDQGSGYLGQGADTVKKSTDYWNNWMTNPSGAYNATLGTAQNTGGALAGNAVNSAVNAGRASGLNAGQAALAGGAQASNAFTSGTLGAQDQLINAGMNSASSNANAGSNMMNTGANLEGIGTGALNSISGQQQNQAQTDTSRNDKFWSGATQALTTPLTGNVNK